LTKRLEYDQLFIALANSSVRNMLKQMGDPDDKSPDRICTHGQMLAEFVYQSSDGSEANKLKKSGLFSHHLRRLVNLKLVIKDNETGFYWITFAGKLALKAAKILEQALDEKTLNDVNKQGRLVFKIERNDND